MRRLHVVSLVAVALVGSLLATGHTLVSAQDTDYAGHPLVGTWTLVVEGERPEMVFSSADGGYVDVDSERDVFIGVWEPTGETTANLAITVFLEEGGGYTIRLGIEVAPDGQSFTASFTYELLDPTSGEGMGEYGPGSATGTRMVAEGPGTPVGSIEDLMDLVLGPPEASPTP
jgi:hypothetical protein